MYKPRILHTSTHTVYSDIFPLFIWIQVESEFILESERESFIEQVREVIENADEKGVERDMKKQVYTNLSLSLFVFS